MMYLLFSKQAMLSLWLTVLLPQLINATFSLNENGPDWSYNATDLKDTTSNKCKEAYSRSIDCTYDLVGIVASMRPGFDPTQENLDAMCVPGCENALQQYVDDVKAACSSPEDAARVLTHASKPYEYGDAPVALVGQMFQYSYSQGCRKYDNGSYCYLDNSAWADTNFDCSDPCYTSFYQNVHDYASSKYFFNYYELLPQTDYWMETFVDGYKHLKSCGKAEPESSTPASSTSTKSNAASTLSPDATSTATGRSSPTPAGQSSSTTGSATAPSATSNSALHSPSPANFFGLSTLYITCIFLFVASYRTIC